MTSGIEPKTYTVTSVWVTLQSLVIKSFENNVSQLICFPHTYHACLDLGTHQTLQNT